MSFVINTDRNFYHKQRFTRDSYHMQTFVATFLIKNHIKAFENNFINDLFNHMMKKTES